jgi:predicted aspartyl protease
MVEGKFYSNELPAPMVPAVISWDGGVQTPFFILDTGFTGDIAVTEELAKDLGLNFDAVSPMQTATGKIEYMSTATAFATMEGETLYVTAILVKGKPLLGISFMQKFKYKAIVDCKNLKVALEVAK